MDAGGGRCSAPALAVRSCGTFGLGTDVPPTTGGLWFQMEPYGPRPGTGQIGVRTTPDARSVGSMAPWTTSSAPSARRWPGPRNGCAAAGTPRTRSGRPASGGLDPVIGGGLRAGALVLLARAAGLGKTTFVAAGAPHRRPHRAPGPLLLLRARRRGPGAEAGGDGGRREGRLRTGSGSPRSARPSTPSTSARSRSGSTSCPGPCEALGEVRSIRRRALRAPLDRQPHRPRRHPGAHRGGPRGDRDGAAGGRRLPAEGAGPRRSRRRGRAQHDRGGGPQGPGHRHRRPGAGRGRRGEAGAADRHADAGRTTCAGPPRSPTRPT